MASSRIIEAIDVFENCHLSPPTGLPRVPPDQLRFDGLEKRFDSSVIVAITLAAHRYLEVVLVQDFLVVVRTILAATIRVMDAALGRCAESNRHLQCPDRKITFHAVADGPTNHATRM